MSYQVLARKWRPKTFKDVVGQSHITQTLINSIQNEKVAHAYLLTGTRGIGKTTIARIFAKAIRCENLSPAGEPCLVCASCESIESSNSLDYLEVDGASNNSVDDIRELVENVQYLPTSGKYKVYVIDEVHMLTVNAFNALLKTLEEPPKHVVFIFATTDPQKLLGTVLSRCLRFDFKNSNVEETKALILEIAASENIKFENDELATELAKQGKGSFRDSLSLFDQVISLSTDDVITEDILMMSLGMAKTKSVNGLVNAVLAKDKATVLSLFNTVLDENIDLKILAVQLLDKLYTVIMNTNSKNELAFSELDNTLLESLPSIEILWVYETLTKDLEWALSSFDPEKTVCFSLVKSALREQIINHDPSTIVIKKKLNKSQPKIENTNDSGKIELSPSIDRDEEKPVVVEKVETVVATSTVTDGAIDSEQEAKSEEVSNTLRSSILAEAFKTLDGPNEATAVETKSDESIPGDKNSNKTNNDSVIQPIDINDGQAPSWELFIRYLYKNSKGTAMNVERGNLLNKEDFNIKGSHLKIAFTKECLIFFDYLNNPEQKDFLTQLMSDYLAFDKTDIIINFELLEDDSIESNNFMSSVHIEEDAIEKAKEARRKDILSNKYIVEAQTLFNSEIDKVILNGTETK